MNPVSSAISYDHAVVSPRSPASWPAQAVGFMPDQQRLIFAASRLKEYPLHLVPRTQEAMHIFLKTLTDKAITVDVEASDPFITIIIKDLFNGREPNLSINPDEAVTYGAVVQDDILNVEASDSFITIIIKDLFNGKEPIHGINPAEAVAYGDAAQDGLLSDEGAQDILLLDVTQLTIGIETDGGVMTKLISRNTMIPTQESQIFPKYQGSQPAVNIQIFKVERPTPKDKYLLGKIELWGILPAPRGQHQLLEVTFEIDSNGILHVGAEGMDTGKSETITIINDKDNLRKSTSRRAI